MNEFYMTYMPTVINIRDSRFNYFYIFNFHNTLPVFRLVKMTENITHENKVKNKLTVEFFKILNNHNEMAALIPINPYACINKFLLFNERSSNPIRSKMA